MANFAHNWAILSSLCIIIAQGTYVANTKARFDDFKVLRVQVPNKDAHKYISDPDFESLYNIWAEPRIGKHSDIMVSPENIKKVVGGLNEMNLTFSIMIENVQRLIELESKPRKTIDQKIMEDHPMTWTEYHSQDDMEAYMDYLADKYSDIVSIEDIGTSYEGRPMRVLKICKGGTCGEKPAMWIDGGIHAREWISPAVTTYHMQQLLENGDAYPTDLLDKLDWYILPVHNPDGYEYTRTDNRMWRKNRYSSVLNNRTVENKTTYSSMNEKLYIILVYQKDTKFGIYLYGNGYESKLRIYVEYGWNI